MPDPQISACGFRIAKQEDFAILEFAASGRVCDGREEIHPLRDDGVGQIGLVDFPERERNTKRCCASGESLRAIGITSDKLGAASIRVGDCGRREQRSLDLDVVHVSRIRNAGFRLRALDRSSDLPDLLQSPNFLRRKIACHAHAEGKSFSVGLFGSATREQGRVRAEHALRAAGPDKGDAFHNLFRRDAKALREGHRIGKGGEAAREVVGAAVPLGLADHCDNLGGIYLTVVNETLQSGNVVGAIHWQLVYADPQGIPQGTKTIMIRLQS